MNWCAFCVLFLDVYAFLHVGHVRSHNRNTTIQEHGFLQIGICHSRTFLCNLGLLREPRRRGTARAEALDALRARLHHVSDLLIISHNNMASKDTPSIAFRGPQLLSTCTINSTLCVEGARGSIIFLDFP